MQSNNLPDRLLVPVVSFNLNGVFGKTEVLRLLLPTNGILCLQEHHLLDFALPCFDTILPGYKHYSIPAIPTGGRPSRGLVTLIPIHF